MALSGVAGTALGPVRWRSSFERCSFTCRRCGACCAIYRVQVDPSDVARMGLGPGELERSGGDEVIARAQSGLCVLNRSGLCSRYAARPVSCRTYPLDVAYLGGGEAVVDAVHTCPYVGVSEPAGGPGGAASTGEAPAGEPYTAERIDATIAEGLSIGAARAREVASGYERARAALADAFGRPWPEAAALEEADAALAEWAAGHQDPLSALFAGAVGGRPRSPPVPSAGAVRSALDHLAVEPLGEANVSCVLAYLDGAASSMRLAGGALEVYRPRAEGGALALAGPAGGASEPVPFERLAATPLDAGARALLASHLAELSRRGRTRALELRVALRLAASGGALDPLRLRGELMYYTACVAAALGAAVAAREGRGSVTRADLRDGIGYADAVAWSLGEADWEGHLAEG